MSNVIKVLVVDDQELVRQGFANLVDGEPGMELVGEASGGYEAIDKAFSRRPDVILMDIHMPDLDGIKATERIIGDDRMADTKVLALTTFDLDHFVYGALRAGASGFLLKDIAPRQLIDAIEVVNKGEALIAPSVTSRLISEFVARPTPAEDNGVLDELTARERDVLAEVGRGLNNNEIAERLYISPLTAKTHVSRILTKLGARDRTQLVVVAYETGLVTPGQQPGASGHVS